MVGRNYVQSFILSAKSAQQVIYATLLSRPNYDKYDFVLRTSNDSHALYKVYNQH